MKKQFQKEALISYRLTVTNKRGKQRDKQMKGTKNIAFSAEVKVMHEYALWSFRVIKL